MDKETLISRYNGKSIDYDGVYGNQCVDLIKQYFKDEGLFIPHGNALDYAQNAHDGVAFVKNTPTGVPKAGDVVVWGSGIGKYGHVAIFLNGDARSFDSLDQNFPLNSSVHVQHHDYKAVLGWLVLPSKPTPPPPPPADPKDGIIAELQESVNKANSRINDLTTQLNDKNAKFDEINGKYDRLKIDYDEEVILKKQCLTAKEILYKTNEENLKALNHCINSRVPVIEPTPEKPKTWWEQIKDIFRKEYK